MIRRDLAVDKAALEKIMDALHELLLRFPLCGFSLLGETVEVRDATHERPNLKTAATNGRVIWYNPRWINTRPISDVVFVLLHEWLHIFNNHVERLGDRILKTWNVAADIYVNETSSELLSESGAIWPIPQDLIQWEQWAFGLTVEQIYDLLQKEPDKMPSLSGDGGELSGGGDLEESPFATESERDEWIGQFRDEIAQSSLMHKQLRGDTLPDYMKSRIQHILADKVPWAQLLQGTIFDQLGHDVPTWAPLRRRFMPYLAMPSYRALKERKLVIPIDVSASVTDRLIQRFISCLTGAAARATETHIIVFDQKVREHYVTKNPMNILQNMKFLAGAHTHTSVVDVFRLVDEIQPSAVCVLTDGFVVLPDKVFPKTLWVIPEGGRAQPWGRTFVMDYAW